MVLLLADADVVAAVHGPDTVRRSIEVIELALLDMAKGETAQAPRLQLMYPPTATTQAESELSLHCVTGMVPSLDAIGARIFTGRRGGIADYAKPAHRHWKLLWDFETLDLVCLFEDVSVHPYLVGAHVAVATRWLARPDARTVAVIGSSKMAMGSLRAICAVREVASATVYSPNAEHRQAFAEQASGALGIQVAAVDDPEPSVRAADIVTCATNTAFSGGEPAVKGEWLSPGTHVSTIASRELDGECFRRAKIVPSSTRSLTGSRPPWEPFHSMMERGEIPDGNLVGDLAHIVSGERAGRTSADDVTLYAGPSLGLMHAAVAAWVYESAQKAGVGRTWDLDGPQGSGAL